MLAAVVAEKVVTNSNRHRVCREDKEPRQAERAVPVARVRVVEAATNSSKHCKGRKEPRVAERAGPVVRARVARVIANSNSRRNSSSKHRDRVSAVADVTDNNNFSNSNSNNSSNSSSNSNSGSNPSRRAAAAVVKESAQSQRLRLRRTDLRIVHQKCNGDSRVESPGAVLTLACPV